MILFPFFHHALPSCDLIKSICIGIDFLFFLPEVSFKKSSKNVNNFIFFKYIEIYFGWRYCFFHYTRSIFPVTACVFNYCSIKMILIDTWEKFLLINQKSVTLNNAIPIDMSSSLEIKLHKALKLFFTVREYFILIVVLSKTKL